MESKTRLSTPIRKCTYELIGSPHFQPFDSVIYERIYFRARFSAHQLRHNEPDGTRRDERRIKEKRIRSIKNDFEITSNCEINFHPCGRSSMIPILESRRGDNRNIGSFRERKEIDLRRLLPGRVNCQFDDGRFRREAILATSSGSRFVWVSRTDYAGHSLRAQQRRYYSFLAHGQCHYFCDRGMRMHIVCIYIYTRKVDGRQTRLHDRREDIVVYGLRTMSMTYSSDERRCESLVFSMKMFLQAFLSSPLPTSP